MPLTLVTGPANSAKAGYVLDAWRAHVADDPLLVVPTYADVLHYQRELAGEGSVLGGAVMVFDRLVAEVARRGGYAQPRVGALQRRLLLAESIAALPLGELAESARSRGFVTAAGELIAELSSALVDPERFAAAMPDRDIASIYTAYRAALDRAGRVDDELFGWRALDALRAAPQAWGTTPVLLYGFDDLTGLELATVETLAGACAAPVTVSLTYEEGRVAFATRTRALDHLEPLADQREQLPADATHYAEPALHHLERTLFEVDRPLAPAGSGISLLQAGGERAEAELVAAGVLELLGGGVAAEEIAVVHRVPQRYAGLYEQVFTAYGVPYACAVAIPLDATALGRGLLALLRCAQADASAEDLLVYLRTPGRLDVPALADRLEERLRRRGVGDLEAALREWSELVDWPLSEVERIRERAGAPADLAGELARRARALLARPHTRRAAVLDSEEGLDAAASAAACQALEEIAGLAELRPAALPDADELGRLLAGLPVRRSTDPGEPGRVQLLGPLDVRARRFHAMFVCGLQEGEFPMPGAPDPFVPDDVRARLADAGIALRPREDRLGDERYLFYATVSRPQALLGLSWRDSDEEGRPLLRSFFVDDVRERFSGELEVRTRTLADVTWPPAQAPTAAELERALVFGGPRRMPPRIQSLRAPVMLDSLAERLLSAGALETYLSCPAKWLVERVLRPELLEPTPMALQRGGLFHAVLEATLTRLQAETGSGRVTEGTLETARRVAGEELERLAGGYLLSTHDATARALRLRARLDLERYLAHEASVPAEGWEPTYYELRFGFEGEEDCDLPALELGDGEVRIRGAIDRVDVRAGEAVVRDYKSSIATPVAKWEEDRTLQVAIYMLAVRRLLKLEPVAGLYQALRNPLVPRGLVRGENGDAPLPPGGFVKTDLRPDEEFEAALAWAESAALAAARDMRAGRVEARPQTCYRGRCQHPLICRSGA